MEVLPLKVLHSLHVNDSARKESYIPPFKQKYWQLECELTRQSI